MFSGPVCSESQPVPPDPLKYVLINNLHQFDFQKKSIFSSSFSMTKSFFFCNGDGNTKYENLSGEKKNHSVTDDNYSTRLCVCVCVSDGGHTVVLN